MNGFKVNPWYFHSMITDCVGVWWVTTETVSGQIDCVEILYILYNTDTSAHLFFPLSLLTAALSSLQLPLSLYLLTHLSRGEVVTQHEGVLSFPPLFSLTCPLLFLSFPSFLLSFTAWNLLSKINHVSLWCSVRALWSAACRCLYYLSGFLKLTFQQGRNLSMGRFS